ncbi:DUF4474 domain-containing protein [Dorea sp. D27]|uniref:DUF4474 domain-containing protein n=1 Tax=Dorea sp. D27 TaxID=658665 RepID=UPI000673C0BF|nr:DUF4474 domain-containing protein [Dorea sp. D27]KMZ53813.1 hypothetical protein HMPREF0980_02040 [Dorea sp. D27]
MYLLFPLLLLFMMVLAVIFHFRKKRIICKIKCMCTEEKLELLNELTAPFGFCYELCHDVFTSRTDAWQREFGYRWLYDKNAAHFNMVFDCEPVYFDYDGRTWMLEFWKGQYGINIGGEIGIYQAERIIPPSERKHVLFHAVPEKDMLSFSVRMYNGTSLLYNLSCRKHWWLAGFSMGCYSVPELLKMDITIAFGNRQMMYAFVDSMYEIGYRSGDINICGNSVSFVFDRPKTPQPRTSHLFSSAWALWKDRLFLFFYCRITKVFCHTLDKLLYLYEYLPFVFRHMMRIHCYSRRKPKRRKTS